MAKKKKKTPPAKSAPAKKKAAPAAKKPAAPRKPTPLKQINILNPERKRMNSKLSRLRKQAEQLKGVRGVGFIREQIKYLTEDRDNLSKKIVKLRKQNVHFEELRGEKRRIKSRQARIDNKLEKLYEDGKIATEEFKKLNNEHLKLSDEIHDINRELGLEEKTAALTEDERDDYFEEIEERLEKESKKKGAAFQWEPAPDTPHTIWEAMRHLDEALAKDRFSIYVIDGEEFESTDRVGIRFTASNFWRVQKAGKTKTPLIVISYDLDQNAVQYEAGEL